MLLLSWSIFSHNFFLLMFRPRHSLSHKSLKFLGIFSTSFYSELYSWSTQFSKRDSFKSYFIFLFVILILFSLFLFAVVLFYVAYHSVLEFFSMFLGIFLFSNICCYLLVSFVRSLFSCIVISLLWLQMPFTLQWHFWGVCHKTCPSSIFLFLL